MENPLRGLINEFHHTKATAAATPTAVPGVGLATQPAATTPASAPASTSSNPMTTVFHDVESFMKKAASVTLKIDDDLLKYTPTAVHIANVVLPEYTLLEDAAGAAVEGGCQMLKTGIIMVQSKYANAPAGPDTNAAKKAEVMQGFGPAALTIFQAAGMKVDSTRLSNIIDATVQILNSNIVPA